MTKRYWSEEAVYARLSSVFDPNAHAIIPQAPNGTGFNAKRHADALVVSCWPSRGLWFAGVEIKISRSDFKNELSQPEKSDEIQRYCKYWYVAAPKDIIPKETIPETWGLIEVDGKTGKITKSAPVLAHTPPDLSFVCAILRASMKNVVAKQVHNNLKEEMAVKIREEAEDIAAKRDPRESSARDELKRLHEAIKEFEKKSGIKFNEWDAGDIGKAVKLILHYGIKHIEDSLVRLMRDIDRALKDYKRIVTDEERQGGE